MNKIYHDPNDPQCDAVERYAKDDGLQCACSEMRGCSDSCQDKKNSYHIYILRSQIMYDVEAELNIITRSRRNENYQQDNNIENTDSIKPLLNRWFGKYLSLVIRKLGANISNMESVNASTNYIKEKEEIDIPLSIGDWWNDNNLSALTSAIHDYIVNGIIYEYLLLYLTAKDAVTTSKEQQLELSLEDIHNILCSYKVGKLRKAYHPFP